jgi:hypothetical protein
MRVRRLALAAAAAGAAIAVAAPGNAYEPYSYRGPGYTYTKPPYTYQPPPYSYTPPNYSYSPPGYTYTPPGYYRRRYSANTPDYYDAYDYPRSAYGDPRAYRQYRRRFGDPTYNRFGNPRNPTDQWNAAPPYESPGNF